MEHLDAPTEAMGWSGGSLVTQVNVQRCKPAIPDPLEALTTAKRALGPKNGETARKATAKAVDFACEALISCEGQLNIMDSGAGDSDCGSTLKRGAEGLQQRIKDNPEVLDYMAKLLRTAGDAAEKDMGGSSGAMFSLLFEASAVSMEGESVLDLTAFSRAFDKGLNAMQEYGRAQPGDRTMIDALHPAFQALHQDLGSDLKTFEAATCAAEKGAANTLTMKARAGRASYVSADELKHPDPGAHAIGVIMRALYQGFKHSINA